MANEFELIKSLSDKKLSVQQEVDIIPKTGVNQQQRYKYAEEIEVVGRLRVALAKHHIGFSVGCGEVVSNERSPKGTQQVIIIKLSIVLIDIETGYCEHHDWLGMGADPGDKALYKAYTSGIKYFLLKTFLIPTGDDVESFPDEYPQSHASQQYGAGSGSKPLSSPQTAREASPTPSQVPSNRPAMSKQQRDIMNMLREHYTTKETAKLKLSTAKLAEFVWLNFGYWPSSTSDAIRAKQFIGESGECIMNSVL